MQKKNFQFWNRIVALLVFAVSAATYLSTIEPSASFWDCGEFIASSYKLEVGHPPGNPVFQLFARVFTMFGDGSNAAVLVNSMSAVCSALTILFLYLTIVFFAKRMVPRKENEWTAADRITILGSGAVGALAYCFSDTFWFSAVEGEVYAMSSLFTAVVFWAMTKWYDVADEPYANRWIVLIAFLMGLSIGVHLLNLLAIPAIVFMYYYRTRENERFSGWELVKIFLISVVILAVILFVIIPLLPKVAAYFDLFFVNVLGAPYNVGAAFFMVALLVLCFVAMFKTIRNGKVFWNTALLCLTTIIVGFSLFSICIIRSSVKTPTNEYQPDNAFTLVRYLSREQYGSTPLVYGQYYDAPFEIKTTKYWAPLDGKYKKVDSPVSAAYTSEGKMLFPRMWSNGADDREARFYASYTGGKGRTIKGQKYKKPTMGANLAYFFDYQLGWMYWRYFLWNFAGRQNDIHSPSPGDVFHGNWECGIGFIDRLRLGDQSDAPAILAQNKGKNHYYLLPLILGLLGLFFQFGTDKRGSWLVFLMFFMTGIAIVIYLNQPPYQVRERDYAYAGSFYFFCIWIGFAVMAMHSWLTEMTKNKKTGALAVASVVACLAVPALMAEENWDDHDRSNRFTAVELASNYLNSVGPNGILITHGDNDTFPLWYAQEVEGIRTDVRICNTSLLGTDWHIDQMRYAVNESAPLGIRVPHKQYLYGTNEVVYIYDTRDEAVLLSDVMKVFRHPRAKVSLQSGKKVDYICARKFIVPVNKANAIRSGIVPAKFAEMIPDSIVLELSKDKEFLTKQELFMLDLLSEYQWDRPIHMLNQGGDLNIGIKNYLMYEGYSYKLVPIRNKISSASIGLVDTDRLYDLMTNVFKWDALKRDDYFLDYQNMYTFMGVMSQRSLFVQAANAFIANGEKDRALEMLDRCNEYIRPERFPLDAIPIGFSGNDYMVGQMIADYFRLGEREKGRYLALRLEADLMATAKFYLEFYEVGKDDFELAGYYLCNYLSDILVKAGEKELSKNLEDNFAALIDTYSRSASRNSASKQDES